MRANLYLATNIGGQGARNGEDEMTLYTTKSITEGKQIGDLYQSTRLTKSRENIPQGGKVIHKYDSQGETTWHQRTRGSDAVWELAGNMQTDKTRRGTHHKPRSPP